LTRAPTTPQIDTAHDKSELAVVDPVDEDDAGVRAGGFRPCPEKRGEVRDVVRDQDALVFGEPEQAVIGQSLEPALLIESADIVTQFAQRAADPTSRDVGIEKQPHRRLLRELKEGIQRP
jgi:hypothetical protein